MDPEVKEGLFSSDSVLRGFTYWFTSLFWCFTEARDGPLVLKFSKLILWDLGWKLNCLHFLSISPLFLSIFARNRGKKQVSSRRNSQGTLPSNCLSWILFIAVLRTQLNIRIMNTRHLFLTNLTCLLVHKIYWVGLLGKYIPLHEHVSTFWLVQQVHISHCLSQ